MNEQEINNGGTEGKLNGVVIFYLIISIICFIVLIILAKEETLGSKYLMIVIGVVTLIQGIILWILFLAGADIIRLLKRLNGLPYGGTISGLREDVISFRCPECGELTNFESKYCTQCGTNLQNEQGSIVE
jgi:predicted RNA-binding Zn-ribbon protein involved in translation (DUF1610 family)